MLRAVDAFGLRLRAIPGIEVLLGHVRREHLREMTWLALSSAISMVLGLGLIRVISGIGTVEFGKYALVVSIVPLFNYVLYIPIDQFSQRFYYTYLYDNKIDLFLASILSILRKIALCLSIVFAFGLAVFCFMFRPRLEDVILYIISFIYVFAFVNAVPFQSLLNTMRLRSLVAAFAVGEKSAQLLLLLGTGLFMRLDASSVLGIFAVIGLVLLAGRMRLALGRLNGGKGGGSPSIWVASESHQVNSRLVAFCLPILFFGLLQWFQTYSERWVIKFALDLESVGVYAFMAMIANAAFAIGLSAFAQFVGPITFEKFSNLKDLKKVATGLRYIRLQVWFVCLVTALAALVLYLVGDWVIELLGGAAGFANYSDLLPVISVGIGLFFIGQTLNSVGFGYDRMGMYIVPKVLGAGLMLVSYWLGARSWGVSGVAWASVVTNCIYVGMTLVANGMILREGPALWRG